MSFILFVAIVALLIWNARLSERIGMLERRAVFDRPVQPFVPANHEHVPAAETRGSSVPSAVNPPAAFPAVPAQAFKPAESRHAFSPAEFAHPAQTEVQQADNAVNWLNRIGVVAVLLGVAFFFKYAVDQGWINEWARVIIGLVVGGLLVYLGELWKEKFGTRAHALSGGGIGVWYFTVFAAYQFYHIIPQPLAFALMIAIAAFSVWLSFRYASLVLGILGFFGAYGSPLLLGSGRDQHIALFVYLTILNAAALAILARKYRVLLLVCALIGTVVDFVAWGASFSSPENALHSLSFVIVTTVLYSIGVVALLRFHFKNNSLSGLVDGSSWLFQGFNGLFFFTSLVLLLDNGRYHSMLAPIALLGSVTFFFAYALVDRLNVRGINYTLSFLGSFFLVASAFWQFHDKGLTFALLLVALFGSSIGTLVKREELRVWGLVILFISLFRSLYQPYGPDDHTFLFNAKFGLMFANTAGLLFLGWLYKKYEAGPFERGAEQILQIVAAGMLWLSVSWDIAAGNFSATQELMTVWWVVYPLALAWVGIAAKRTGLLKLSLLLLAASFLKVLFLPYANQYTPVWNAKFGLMTFEAVAVLGMAWVLGKNQEDSRLPDAMNALGSMLFWFAVSWEIVKYFQGSESGNARNLILSLWWIVYAAALITVSAVLRSSVFRKLAISLFGLSIVKVFVYDSSALDTPYRVVAFIMLGVILLAVSFAYQKNKERITQFIEGGGNPS